MFGSWPFNTPKTTPKLETKYRKICSQIPHPESLKVLEDLEKYEARAMHGQLPIVWDKAKDFQIWDKYGNCWIDFTSTIFVANVGHANPEIKKTIQNILNKDLLATYNYASDIRAEYLKKLIEFTPKQFEKAFLLSAGTEATECAIKLIRMYAGKKKSSGRYGAGIISFEGSMHGRTMGAQMICGNEKSRSWIGYQDPNTYKLEFPYPWKLKDSDGSVMSGKEKFLQDIRKLKAQGVNFDTDIGGFILEAYIGWGAILIPVDYTQELARFAKKHDILVCVDEIQGGFGRSGKLFVYEHYGIEPDMICCGKGISSSLPLSAVLSSKEIMDITEIGAMSSTHSANPLCCATGLANIEVLKDKNLIAESERKGILLHSKLNKIKDKYSDRISYVFGKGLLAGILFINPKTKKPDSEFATKVCVKAMQKGLLLVHTGRESVKIGPPLTIPDDALSEGLDVLEECIAEVIKEENESS